MPTSRAFLRRLLLCLLLGLGTPAAWAATSVTAPDWTLDSSTGRSVQFHRDARGAPAVLFFWASWCPHCGAALPAMEALYQQFAPRGVRFYAMNIWEDGDAVAYFARHGYHLPLFLAADLVAEDYGVEGTPAVIVVDGEMHIRDLNIDGAAPEEIAASLRLFLEAALNHGQDRTVTAK
ncbi:MAG: TlpA family protein disulfide reductase [Gammaproteobacteria bacterium]|nr:TlpA family protein disulfide reductase [Gammaproteobacteria bacterium]